MNSLFHEIDQGKRRVCEKHDNIWHVNEDVKKALVEMFGQFESKMMPNNTFDKIPLKFEGWSEDDFKKHQIRIVPGSIVRFTAYLAPHVIIMPSFVNIGAYIDEGTLIDSLVTVGSCVTIGKKCHISSGATLAGVLEPIQAQPVIIEDNCFIGANTVIAEGVVVRTGAVIGAGVCITASTPIYDRNNETILYGEVPPYSVIVPGVFNNKIVPTIVKQVNEQTRGKTKINELLRT